MSPPVTTNSKTAPLEFENNINHGRLLKTFGNKRVTYFIALHLDGISGITCLQTLVTEEVIQRSVDCKAVDLRNIFLPF